MLFLFRGFFFVKIIVVVLYNVSNSGIDVFNGIWKLDFIRFWMISIDLYILWCYNT